MQKSSYLPLAALIAFSPSSWSDSRLEEAFSPSGSTPQLFISGSIQHPRNYAGQAHALIPMWESEEADISGYGYLTGQLSAQDWSIGAGGGIRTPLEPQLTIGGYGLIEHQRSELGHGYWRFSPGIELQGEGWHLSANAYIPLGQNMYRGNELHASSFTKVIDYTQLEFTRFKGHTGFLKTPVTQDFLQTTLPTPEHWETGIRGIDLIGSWQITAPLTLSLGGYYLPSQTQSRIGIVAGFAYQMNPLTLEVQAHQDREDRQVQARVSLHLGNTTESASPSARWKPLQRPGAQWAKPVLQSYAKDTPNTDVPEIEIPPEAKLENLYFFEAEATGTACTAEKPCGKISQTLVNNMPKGSLLLLAEGGSFEVEHTNLLRLRNSQSILGRNAGFKQPADLAKRPTINGTTSFCNGKDIVVSRIKIQNSPAPPTQTLNFTALSFEDSHNALVQHVQLISKDAIMSLAIAKSSNVQVLNSESIKTSNKSDNFNHDPLLFGAIAIWDSSNIRIAHNTFNHAYTQGVPGIPEICVSSGVKKIIFEDNAVLFSGKSDKVLGINIDDNVTEFSVNRNRFDLNTEGSITAMMVNIDGTTKKSENNNFTLKAPNGKTVTTHTSSGSNAKQLSPGEEHTDTWNNKFKRSNNTSNPSSWLGSLFSW